MGQAPELLGVDRYDLMLLDLIFQPFFRVDKSRGREFGGAGSGLSPRWKIAGLHGGSVWVEESSKMGATSAAELPTKIYKATTNLSDRRKEPECRAKALFRATAATKRQFSPGTASHSPCPSAENDDLTVSTCRTM